MLLINTKKEYIIIILLILLVIVLSILKFQVKCEVIHKLTLPNEQFKENVSVVEVTENLRKHYLKEYLKTNFYSQYSEESLLDKFDDIAGKMWTLDIESINLSANISKGTDEEVLNKYIGHFDETNIFNGNVGLAAHNRGYPVNYFENLDKVKIGVVIDYRIGDFIKKYKVSSIQVIKDTDWSYLEDTKEDTLTLITCVRNKPDYRLCVQAHKESEEILNNAEENFSSRYGNNFIIKCDIYRKC